MRVRPPGTPDTDFDAVLDHVFDNNPESDVLGRFPLPLRRALVDSVASSLLAPPPAPGNGPPFVAQPVAHPTATPFITGQQWIGIQQSSAWLVAPAHVWWAMEVVGQGFALPVDDLHKDVVERCLAIYAGWLLGAFAFGEDPTKYRQGTGDHDQAYGLGRLRKAFASLRPFGVREGNPLAAFKLPGSAQEVGTPVLQWFYQTCFRNLSQLFQPRTPAFGYK